MSDEALDGGQTDQIVVAATSDLGAVGANVELDELRALIARLSSADLEASDGPTSTSLPRAWSAPVLPAHRLEHGPDTLGDRSNHIFAALLVTRRDIHAQLLSGDMFDAISGLKPDRTLGPFRTDGGIEAWFDVFLPAHQLVVRVDGAPTPALVLTNARLPKRPGLQPTVRLDAGTVWIRADLVGNGFPADSYVGIKHSGGSFQPKQPANVTGSDFNVTAPFHPILKLKLTADLPGTAPGGCDSAASSIELPTILTLSFNAGGLRVSSDAGTATAWGQTFVFDSPDGTVSFLPRLWSAAFTYKVAPAVFHAAPIADDVIRFAGDGNVADGALTFPVVQTSNPAILATASRSGEWLLDVVGLRATWYEPDARPHKVALARIGMSNTAAFVLSEDIAALVPVVEYEYSLWKARNSSSRFAWKNRYPTPFWLLYRCDAVTGELLFVEGEATVAIDRPVTTTGVPIPTPTGTGATLVRRNGDTTRIVLGGRIHSPGRHQLALSNALVWTTAPPFALVDGTLVGRTVTDATLELPLGVVAWSPILPDPYVSNGRMLGRRIEATQQAQSLVTARVRWTDGSTASVTFDGWLANAPAVSRLEAGDGSSGPSRRGSDPFGILTQTEQHTQFFDDVEARVRESAYGAFVEGTPARADAGYAQDRKAVSAIDSVLKRVVGGSPGLVLLDVSTNQDLLGIAIPSNRGDGSHLESTNTNPLFTVSGISVESRVASTRVVALPQVQWEPVRTLDADQDILTLGWFPTPLASASDGGATVIGSASQKLRRLVPDDLLGGQIDAFDSGLPVVIRTTFPFGLIGVAVVNPNDDHSRPADILHLTRPKFDAPALTGGIQVTAKAEGGRAVGSGVSPMFAGALRQLLNGVDLASGVPLGISVIGSTGDPTGSVETVFNNDMESRPRLPVTRIDVSGYGASNFSDWNNPFAAFAEAAKVQFRVMVGRTALEIIKVNSVLHPWGIRVTRSVTVERRGGGGVIRRDSGWQAFTPGLFDYRYFDETTSAIEVAPYEFDTGVFRGLFDVRTIRPAPGQEFTADGATFVPYFFDADVAIDGVASRTLARGILGFLQTAPNGVPASEVALRSLIEQQGPVGGPIDVWTTFGASPLAFRAQRIEVGLADNSGTALFVATLRGAPALPTTGAWSVVSRPVTGAPPGGGEATPVTEQRGVPYIRRSPVRYDRATTDIYDEPRIVGPRGDHRFADAADLLVATNPATDYAILQSTPSHAFLLPRPYVVPGDTTHIRSGHRAALADLIARSTSKGAFPPAPNTIEFAPGSVYFDVAPTGTLALPAALTIVGHPTPLQVAGSTGHGTALDYSQSTIHLEISHTRWSSEFTGLQLWSDIIGLNRLTGNELRIVGSTQQRPQIAEMKSLLLAEIEQILQFIPIFGQRGTQGPLDLGASNGTHELKFEAGGRFKKEFELSAKVSLEFEMKAIAGASLEGAVTSAEFGATLEGRFPILTIGVASVFVIVSLEVKFSIASVTGAVTSEELELTAFAGIGVEGKIGPFKAYAYLGVGFVLVYDATADQTKYGGLVALEAGIDLEIVDVKIRAELKGLVYDDAGTTKCDYSGTVEINVDIFLIISISASYEYSDTAEL